jgi:NAD+-dependent protein deacetylase SIR2
MSLGELISDLQEHDLSRKDPFVDALVVIGTSLKIPGLKNLIKSFADRIHSRPGGVCVFMNLTAPNLEWKEVFDYVLLGPCDEIVSIISPLISQIRSESKNQPKV